jgi:hypothetical protein
VKEKKKKKKKKEKRKMRRVHTYTYSSATAKNQPTQNLTMNARLYHDKSSKWFRFHNKLVPRIHRKSLIFASHLKSLSKSPSSTGSRPKLDDECAAPSR